METILLIALNEQEQHLPEIPSSLANRIPGPGPGLPGGGGVVPVFATRASPGERRTPRSLILAAKGYFVVRAAALHRRALTSVLPIPLPFFVVLYKSWYSLTDASCR